MSSSSSKKKLFQKIPTHQPNLDDSDIDAVVKVLKSRWWGTGQVTSQLETEFAQYVGAKYAIAVDSGTAALHLSLAMLSPQSHQNIITTPLTFLSTAMVAKYFDLEIRFADIDPDTLCLDPAQVTPLIDHNTLAIIPVHFAGMKAVTDYHAQVPIIEDCAHAIGTKGAGQTGVFACWSFHPVKNIATGNGGMITTSNKHLAQKLKQLRWMGIRKDAWSRFNQINSANFRVQEVGYKYNPSDIHSALALSQLQRIDQLNQKRRRIADRYTRHLTSLPIQLITPPHPSSYHQYPIILPPDTRRQFIKYLFSAGISTGLHYKPLHHYQLFDWDHPLPHTDRIWPRLVDLPIYPDLTRSQQDHIIHTIHRFFK